MDPMELLAKHAPSSRAAPAQFNANRPRGCGGGCRRPGPPRCREGGGEIAGHAARKSEGPITGVVEGNTPLSLPLIPASVAFARRRLPRACHETPGAPITAKPNTCRGSSMLTVPHVAHGHAQSQLADACEIHDFVVLQPTSVLGSKVDHCCARHEQPQPSAAKTETTAVVPAFKRFHSP